MTGSASRLLGLMEPEVSDSDLFKRLKAFSKTKASEPVSGERKTAALQLLADMLTQGRVKAPTVGRPQSRLDHKT